MGLILNGSPGIKDSIGIAYCNCELCTSDLIAGHISLGDRNSSLFVNHLNAIGCDPIALLEDEEAAGCIELEVDRICGQVACGSLGLFKSVDRIHYEYAVGDLSSGVC